jgi:hypothetical protein
MKTAPVVQWFTHQWFIGRFCKGSKLIRMKRSFTKGYATGPNQSDRGGGEDS